MLVRPILVPLRLATTVLEWGPPEEGVRFLIHAAEDPGRRGLAIPELEAWAESWNAKHGIPEAPPKMEDVTQYLMAWKAFYKALKEYPLHEALE